MWPGRILAPKLGAPCASAASTSPSRNADHRAPTTSPPAPQGRGTPGHSRQRNRLNYWFQYPCLAESSRTPCIASWPGRGADRARRAGAQGSWLRGHSVCGPTRIGPAIVRNQRRSMVAGPRVSGGRVPPRLFGRTRGRAGLACWHFRRLRRRLRLKRGQGAVTLHLMGLPHFPCSSATRIRQRPLIPHGDFSLRS